MQKKNGSNFKVSVFVSYFFIFVFLIKTLINEHLWNEANGPFWIDVYRNNGGNTHPMAVYFSITHPPQKQLDVYPNGP